MVDVAAPNANCKTERKQIMSLQSYEAVCEHGQMKWLGDRPHVEGARVISIILSDKKTVSVAVKHQPSARISGKGKILSDILTPAAPIEDWNCAK